MLVLLVSTPALSRLGCTSNQAAPARTCVSPAIITTVSNSPHTLPLINCVCCMRSSPASSRLVVPFCCVPGGRLYASELMTILDRVGTPPVPTAWRLVMAQTPMRVSPVPCGISLIPVVIFSLIPALRGVANALSLKLLQRQILREAMRFQQAGCASMTRDLLLWLWLLRF